MHPAVMPGTTESPGGRMNAVLILIAAPAGNGEPIQDRFRDWDLWRTVTAVDDMSETVVPITRTSAYEGRDRQVKMILYKAQANTAVT